MAGNFSTTILASEKPQNLQRLVEVAEFWKIPYDSNITKDHIGTIFSSGRIERSIAKDHYVIISPCDQENAGRLASEYGLECRSQVENLTLRLNRTNSATLNIYHYEFSGQRLEPIIRSGYNKMLSRVEGTDTYVLSLDLVGEYERRLYGGLDDSPSTRFRLLSKLPVSYNIIPQRIRDWSLRRSLDRQTQENNLAAVDFLRILFLASLAAISDKPIPRIGFWRKGKKYSMAITHDVETSYGLRTGSKQLLHVEKEIGVRSTWNIPSDRYYLPREILSSIASEGDIGAHDTVHDGRLILSSLEEKIDRTRKAKEKLERLSGASVVGFRSPLLQHSRELLTAIGKAGYEYDSSTPSSETISPTSSKPHGTSTVFPFEYGGILEIPVSLPQDHQLTRIRQLNTSDAAKKILDVASHVRELGGVCVLLIHPDYEYGLPENEGDYKSLLEAFQADISCEMLTMKQIAGWWKKRMETSIDLSNTEPRLIRPQPTASASTEDGLHIEMITGYDKDGFRVEAYS